MSTCASEYTKGGMRWQCTLPADHDATHVTLAGGITFAEWGAHPAACVAALEHLHGSDHRWQDCPVYAEDDAPEDGDHD